MAMKALRGVGSESLGQWHEDGPGAYHVRRRLTDQEALRTGPAKDLRGTVEARVRADEALAHHAGTLKYDTLLQLVEQELGPR